MVCFCSSGREHIFRRYLPGRSFPDVRHRRREVQQHESGAAQRSYGRGVSTDNEVYIPQVRSFRHDPEARRSLRSGAEHSQREDIHIPVVLVYHPRFDVRPCADVQHRGRSASQHPRNYSEEAIQVWHALGSQRSDPRDPGESWLSSEI